MTLKDLVDKNSWTAIRKEFLKIFPDQKKSILGYKKVFNDLRTLTPSKGKLKKLVIITVDDEDDGTFSDGPWVDVYAQDCKTKNTYHKDNLERFALDFTKWEELLPLEIDEDSMKNFSEEKIISHLLWNITFYGFYQEQIKEKLDEIMDRSKEAKEHPEKLIPFEEVKENLLKKIEEMKNKKKTSKKKSVL